MASITHTFDGKKPSQKQVINKVTDLLNSGFSQIVISWGENALDFEVSHNELIGWGWIKNISGHDTAKLINIK